ncbi:MAG TPA: TonB-dependent receptor [Sphingobium sp.]|uniref:TonB-dependent receptor n=1 Tax=Sphingobium sp. TaxID=1912891 RepID=UPI002ED476A8
MTDGFRHSLRASSALLAFFTTIPAFAQSVDAGEIIVTARRTEERLQDVPISMTVVTPQQIIERNIVVAADLATYTPSLSVNQRYGPEKSSFAIRGFNQDQSTAPTVGVYFADVVGVRAQGGTTSGNTVGAGAFMDLQNVQVLKGPQGTLFGRNTTGGAILLVPQKPTARFEGYVEGQVGDYDLRRIQAVVNVPVNDSLRLRMGVDRNTRDGYMRNKSGIGPGDYNDVDYVAARFSVVADLAPNLENYTIVSYSDSDTNGYASRYATCDTKGAFVTSDPAGTPVPPGSISIRGLTGLACAEQQARQRARGDGPLDVDVGNPRPYQSLETWQIINTTTWAATDWLTVKNIASYGEFREKSNFNLYSDNFRVPAGANFIQVPTGSPVVPNSYLPITPGTPFQYIRLDVTPGEDNAGQSTATEELQFQGHTSDGKFNWVVGGYLEFSRPLGWSSGRTGIFLNCVSVATGQCTNPLYIGTISASRTKYDFDNHGIYGQGTYKITRQLSLTLGGRYTFDKIRGQGESTRIIPGAGQFCNDTLRFKSPSGGRLFVTDPSQCHYEITQSTNKPTWLIDVDFKPQEDLLLYAKYSRGYRQGGISFTNVGLETWQPEKVDAYEIGAKFSFHGRVNGFFNVAGFYNDFSNQQIFGATIAKPEAAGQAGAAAIVNAGKSELKGVEVDASISPLEGLRFDVGYTYLDTKLKSLVVPTLPADSPFIRIDPTAKVGDPLTLSPKNRVTLTGTYTLPLAERIGRVSLSATYVHTDSQISNGSVPPDVAYLGIVPATDLLNLNVGWNKVMGTGLDAAFFMTNVTNQIYPVNTGGGYQSSGIGDWLMGQPRMYGFRLRYNFGQ